MRRDPWRAATLEWAMPIPPTPYAFASIPHVERRTEDIAPGKLALSLARGEGWHHTFEVAGQFVFRLREQPERKGSVIVAPAG